MKVQYVHDENDRRIGVIIPIDLWSEIRFRVEEVEEKEVFNPSKYRGIYRNLEIDLKNEIKNLREEWIRM
jgi:hypothetical protein